MPTTLSLGEHLAALSRWGACLADWAEQAGPSAPVPTCPDWTVAHLLAHQAMVHRWATAHLSGEDARAVPNQTRIRSDEPDLLGYYREGLATLLSSLEQAADDTQALVFLCDAPPPRQFWARRQAHETTIHAVDALAALLGRAPKATEVDVPARFAADGIDELVFGFLPRPKSKFRSDEPLVLLIRPSDVADCWTLRVSADPVVSERGISQPPDAQVCGTAAELYLGLWNRGDQVATSGRPGVLDAWRRLQQVRWD